MQNRGNADDAARVWGKWATVGCIGATVVGATAFVAMMVFPSLNPTTPSTPVVLPSAPSTAGVDAGQTRLAEPVDGNSATADSALSLPPPPIAHRVEQVPEFTEVVERGLEANPVAVGSAESRAVLSGVASLLARGFIPREDSRRLESMGLNDAVQKTYLIVMRSGRLPDVVRAVLDAELEAGGSSPNLGVWNAEGDRFDFAALAAFARPHDPRYLRALLAARSGPDGWVPYARERSLPDPPWLDWLAMPGAAYRRLRDLDRLTGDEHDAWCQAVGLEPIDRIAPTTGDTVPDCDCPGAEEPVTWEALREHYPFTVPGGCLGCDQGESGRAQMVYFDYGNGGRVGVNGSGQTRFGEPTAIWADDPDQEGTKVSVGDLISRGLMVCGRE